ncbi:Panacea domain-containing protein [Acinetobacter johnsonii]|uniref:Panacea domain-containing protein n=1 Tax=Acinetobacter johnsonii TaxID=40214 RepID=UPI001919E6CE|nr:type II toxin-antitoxin system antitoxin SocA domain-containing protein [Acinetobacter johnsonii]QQT57142.1 DUF4065 domain-containing protein [Acinetobacter johnsonii]
MNNYSAMEIANYIVWYVNHFLAGRVLTPLKLQKLLYYVQVNHLVHNHGNPLFSDSIQKWQYGPVVPSVYFEFKDNGVSHISEPKSSFSFIMNPEGGFSFEFTNFNPSIIHSDAAASSGIERVLSHLIDRDPFQLVHKTHMEDVWLKDQARIMMGEKSIEYTNQELFHYFSVHSDFLRT